MNPGSPLFAWIYIYIYMYLYCSLTNKLVNWNDNVECLLYEHINKLKFIPWWNSFKLIVAISKHFHTSTAFFLAWIACDTFYEYLSEMRQFTMTAMTIACTWCWIGTHLFPVHLGAAMKEGIWPQGPLSLTSNSPCDFIPPAKLTTFIDIHFTKLIQLMI